MLSKGTEGAKDEPPQMEVFHAVEGPLLRYQTSGEKTLFWADLWGDLFLLSQIWASGEVRQNTSPLSKYTKFMKSNVLSISKKSYISYIKIFIRIWPIFPQTLVKLTQTFFVVQGTEATIVTGGHLSWAAWSIWNVQGHEKHKDYSLWICWTLPKQYNTRMLNVWYIYLHLPPKLPKCR